MTTTLLKVGPGQLIFGEAGSAEEFNVQIASAQVDPSVEDGELVPVLSGGQVAEEDEYTYVLSGNFFQDITTEGITTYTWENKGQTVPFTYVPNAATGRGVTGEVKIRPTTVGGEARQNARADFEFPIVGEPQLATWVDPNE